MAPAAAAGRHRRWDARVRHAARLAARAGAAASRASSSAWRSRPRASACTTRCSPPGCGGARPRRCAGSPRRSSRSAWRSARSRSRSRSTTRSPPRSCGRSRARASTGWARDSSAGSRARRASRSRGSPRSPISGPPRARTSRCARGNSALANPRFLSGAALALAGLFIAREAYALRERLISAEWQLAQALAVWGLAWWAGAWAAEIDQFLPRLGRGRRVAARGERDVPRARARGRRARAGCRAGCSRSRVIPTAFVALPIALEREEYLFAGSAAIAWPLLLAVDLRGAAPARGIAASRGRAGVMRPRSGSSRSCWASAWPASSTCRSSCDGDWPIAAFAIGPVLALLGAQPAARARRWARSARFAALHLGAGAAPLAALSVLWFLAINLRAQRRRRAAALSAAARPGRPRARAAPGRAGRLVAARRRTRPPVLPGEWRAAVAPGFAALAFVWLNGLLVRSVVQWAGVPFDADALWDSTPLQAALSISWTLVALGAMVCSTRRGWRSALDRGGDAARCHGGEALRGGSLHALHGREDRHVPRGGRAAARGGISLAGAARGAAPPASQRRRAREGVRDGERGARRAGGLARGRARGGARGRRAARAERLRLGTRGRDAEQRSAPDPAARRARSTAARSGPTSPTCACSTARARWCRTRSARSSIRTRSRASSSTCRCSACPRARRSRGGAGAERHRARARHRDRDRGRWRDRARGSEARGGRGGARACPRPICSI